MCKGLRKALFALTGLFFWSSILANSPVWMNVFVVECVVASVPHVNASFRRRATQAKV